MKKLFIERHGDAVPRVKEKLDDVTRNGLAAVVQARIDEEWFGDSFPSICPDGRGNGGSDKAKLATMMKAYGVIWPADHKDYCRTGEYQQVPSDGQVFDLIEFSYKHVSELTAYDSHSYFGHSHYSYDQKSGRQKLEQDVNRLFERNGIPPGARRGYAPRTSSAPGDAGGDYLQDRRRQDSRRTAGNGA